jgi:hypothetical protein
MVPKNTTLAVAGNFYESHAGDIRTTYWGPTVSVTKAFYEKTLRASIASSYNETSGTVKASPILSNRIGLNYTPKPGEDSNHSHNFSLGLNVLNRLKSVGSQPSFTEVTGTFNYSYSF